MLVNNAEKSALNIKTSKQHQSNLDILDVIHLLWAEKLLILFIVFLSIFASVWVALTQDEMYIVELKATPSETSLAPTADSLNKTLALRLDGFGKAVSAYEKHLVAVQVLRSYGFLSSFIEKHQVTPLIFAVDSWDKKTDMLVWDTEIYDSINQSWLINKPPTVQDATLSFINNHLFIEDDRSARVLTVKFTHQSPTVAAQMVNLLIQDLNKKMMEKELEELTTRLTFYKNELLATKIQSTRSALNTLIEQTTYDILLTRASKDYLFEVIDPPMIPDKRSYPRRGLLVIIGMAFGLLLAVIVAFLKSLLIPLKSTSHMQNN